MRVQMARTRPAGENVGHGGRILPLLVVALLLALLVGPAGALGSEPGRADDEATPPPAAASSIRPHGPEAPVTPSPTATASTTSAAKAAQPSAVKAAAKRAPVDEDVRVWPLKSGTFTFTQAYGCVDQIAGYYRAVAGCPVAYPVFHSGIDLAATAGTTVYAAAAGWVVHAGPDRETGLANSQIIIQHVGANDGYATEYLHWRASYVKEGDFVRAGQPIAEVGSVGYSTGPHLHFGVVEFGTGERIDPIGWLPRQSGSGVHLGLAPNAKRYPIAEHRRDLPDYADPSPPPAPKRERVPRRAPKASAGETAPTGEAKTARTSKEKSKHQRHDKRRDGKHAKDAAATATPAAKPDRSERRRDRRNAAATATPAPDTTPAKKERRRDRKAADPTVAPEPTAAWVNGYVPPVPARPDPLLPGVVAPTPTPAPEAEPTKAKGAKRDRADKPRKRDSADSASSGKHRRKSNSGSDPEKKTKRRASGE